jgi:hypothetical protein
LFAWAPTAQRNGSHIEGCLHRPVEQSEQTLVDALRTTLRWGCTEAQDVSDIWQTGLAPADKPALLETSVSIELNASNTDALSGFHDLDLAIGHAGNAAAWLAIALAAEYAALSGKPQIVATRGHGLRLAVVQPQRAPDAEHAQKPMENRTKGNE